MSDVNFSSLRSTSRFTRQFNLTCPIALAPMAGAAGGALAAACAQAGALGLVGGGYGDLDWVQKEYNKAFESCEPALHPRLGIGFITWRLQQEASALDWVLDQAFQPAAVMFSFGDSRAFATKVRAANIALICQVQRLDQLPMAIEAGATVIVAQGGEAGGHGMNSQMARGTFTLVPEVADWLAKHSPETQLLAAGGIADSRGLAAAQLLGADGAVIGSRLWVTKECLAPTSAKAQSVTAHGDQTARSSVFDVLRGLDWPHPYDFRALRNEIHRQWEHQVAELKHYPDNARQDYAEGLAQEDYTRAHVTVGEATGLIHDMPSAVDCIRQIATESERRLKGFG
ncbi:MAG: nitronate monooxygenase [Orrella sp.]